VFTSRNINSAKNTRNATLYDYSSWQCPFRLSRPLTIEQPVLKSGLLQDTERHLVTSLILKGAQNWQTEAVVARRLALH